MAYIQATKIKTTNLNLDRIACLTVLPNRPSSEKNVRQLVPGADFQLDLVER